MDSYFYLKPARHSNPADILSYVSRSSAAERRVMRDGRLVQRETRIKYLQDRPEVRPLLLEDGAHNNWMTPAMMWGSLAFAAFCVFGWWHMLRFERRAMARKAGVT